ncbi:MAG: signal peptide peptidase SppA [Phycisphaeraceae bacterium]|nr:signal peptide peptidase SppA [Phycisphaeraceae bacterium]
MNDQNQMHQSPPSDSGRPPIDPPPAYPPPPPPSGNPSWMMPPPPRQRSVFARALAGLLVSALVVSLLVNFYLAIILSSMTAGISESTYRDGDKANRIVILPIRGLIDDSSAAFVRQSLDVLRKKQPKAVVLLVDSGGGYVAPSDRIWKYLAQFKQETGIPLIASFGSMAASGGYYVAASADAIVAEPTCLTGSIGVMSQAFTIDQLLVKVGITPQVQVASGSPEKDTMNDITRPWTEKDKAAMLHILDAMHAQFVSVVQQGRSAQLNADEVAALADGRVFTAQEALASKLVDQVGYLDDAIALAGQRANLSTQVQPQVTILQQPQSLLGSLFSSQQRSIGVQVDTQALRRWIHEETVPQVMYLWQGG